MAKIGFIGLGNMGSPMARNLLQAGHQVCAFDADPNTLNNAAEGITRAENNAGAVDAVDIAILMLPHGAIVKDVAREILPTLQPGKLLIDCSTIDVASAKAVHDICADASILSLDAPVSGGVGGADAGTLTFMVGGSDAAFKIGKPVFDVMGQKAVHCGTGGAGQAAKICNNMLLGISMIGTCETFNLAKKLGLSHAALFDVISTSSGSCWSVNSYCPVPDVGPESPADRNYQPGFAAALMLKDLSLAMQAAQDTTANTPLGQNAKALYQSMVDDGGGNKDFSGMIAYLEEQKTEG